MQVALQPATGDMMWVQKPQYSSHIVEAMTFLWMTSCGVVWKPGCHICEQELTWEQTISVFFCRRPSELLIPQREYLSQPSQNVIFDWKRNNIVRIEHVSFEDHKQAAKHIESFYEAHGVAKSSGLKIG